LSDRKSIFITGGGSGIGASLTEGFLRQGAKVAFVQRSDATAFCDEMEAACGNRPLFIQCDITNVAALRAAIAQASEAHGTVTRLVNNAANDNRHDTLEVDEAYFDAAIAINFKSYFFACQAAIPGMIEAGGGKIINFSSISYMMGNGAYPLYTGSNAGIMGMTRSIARDYGKDGIRANALMPGWVLTDRQMKLWANPEALKSHLARQCIPEHLKPEDIVGSVLFLASDASRMITSQAIVVDGGTTVTG
jgi:NAD(P)-dependent dehydrogenase (short-subunit alcohol dehydrogenase family)